MLYLTWPADELHARLTANPYSCLSAADRRASRQEVLLVAERTALLDERDDELRGRSPSLTPECGGARSLAWNATSCSKTTSTSSGSSVRSSGRFYRLPPKDGSYGSTNYEPLLPVDLPALPLRAAARLGREVQGPGVRLRRGSRRRRQVRLPRPRRCPPLPAQRLQPPRLPASVRRPVPLSEGETRQERLVTRIVT